MTPLNVDTSALIHIGGRSAERSHRIHAAASVETICDAELTPTFGLVGARFLAAVTKSAQHRQRTLDALACRHAAIADSTDNSARAYLGTDAHTARSLSAGASR